MIYYVNQDGSIVGGTQSDDLNGITALHSATYAVYIDDATVNSVTNNGTAQGTLSIASLTPNGTNRYGIPTATGTLTFTATSAATLLANAQQAKIASLTASLANAISTFQSSALGTAHTYLADPKSMAFLTSEYAFVRSTDYDQSTINWYTVENNMVSHTGAQIAQVFLDGHAWVKNQESHKDRLEAQIKAATTVSQAQSITWTTPPNVPTGLAGTAGTGQASLTWTANTEADLAGYNVYQNGVKVNASLLTTASDTITGLTSGTTYSFTVTAVDVNGNESAQCTAVSVKAN